MFRRSMALVVVWAVALTTAVVGGLVATPAGAAPQAFTLQMPDGGGQLLLRDAEQPADLLVPTLLSGSVDDATGAIQAELSTPTLRAEREVVQGPVTALAVIDATFTPDAPGTTTGTVDSDGNVVIQTRLRADLHVEVFLAPGQPPTFVADCVTRPVALTLESDAPYTPANGGAVTIADDDFTIPTITPDPECDQLVYDALQDELVGPGHSLSIALTGELPLPEPAGDETVTTLAVDPAGQARVGQSVTMTATVAPGPDATEAGPAAGLVDFLVDGDVVGSAPLDGAGVATFATDALPSGSFPVQARYRGQSPFRRSESAALPYVVSPDPTVTSSLPAYVPVGGPGTEFDVTVTNPAGGAAVALPGLAANLYRSNSPTLLNRVRLERQVGADWVDVPLTTTPGLNRSLDGSLADPAWAPLDPGEQLVVHLRLVTDSTVALSALDVTFSLVDDLAAPERVVLASATTNTRLIVTDRVATTVTASLEPLVIRQGNQFHVRRITVRPSVGGTAQGNLTMTIDGTPVPIRRGADPVAEGFRPTVPIDGTVMARMPAGATGTRTVVLQFSGNDYQLPSQVALSVEVLPALGPVFTCTATVGNAPLTSAFNLQVLAGLPATARSGDTVDLVNPLIRASFDRGPTPFRLGVVSPDGTYTVGDGTLESIALDLGPEGSGSASGYVSTNGSIMTDATEDPDMRWELQGEEGSVTVTGDPGDVVPVTLAGVDFAFLDLFLGGLPYTFTCDAVGGPVTLGTVTIVGADLAVSAPDPARVGDDVTLTSTVFPSTGSVEFFDGDTSLGVSRVVDGQAVRVTDDLAAGDHEITARHTTASGTTDTNAVDLTVLPTYDCAAFAEAGAGSIVRLAYMELLRRCPDAAGFAFWKGQLAAGVSAQRFAATIADTDEARNQVVIDGYRTMLERDPSGPDAAFWRERLERRGGRYQQLLAELAASPEFFAKAGSTRAGVVARVYDRILQREASESDIDYWVGEMLRGTSRAKVVARLADLTEPLGRIVDASYDEILSSPPSAGERTAAIAALRATGDRTALYTKLIGDARFALRAAAFPNPED